VAGAALAFGSDAPVEPIDPIRGIHAAVTSRTADAPAADTEQLSRATALYAHTHGAAHAAFQEDRLGSITPGKRADFVVLSQDLMTVASDRLLDTDVVATYLDGSPVYARPEWPEGQ
jgi:hypothetical protein